MIPFENNKTQGNKMAKTSKKKDTYTLKLDNVMVDINMFSMCQKAPLAVVKMNGEYYPDDDRLATVLFRNPGAVETVRCFKENQKIFGEKIAFSQPKTSAKILHKVSLPTSS